ncbi:MAG: DUF3299 domain-containing protein [Phycisphaera sp.]|nr:DUF3299 domain-containing protein [Phycisphaera sp.]
MKILWSIVALLLLAGLIVLLQPPSPPEAARIAVDAPREEDRMVEEPSAPAPAERVEPATASVAPSAPATAPSPSPSPSPSTPARAPEPSTAGATGSSPEAAPATAAAPPAAKDEPSAEPPPPDPSVVASGSSFTPEIPSIPDAEILPSTFIRLPDGSISVDDAWTIRGAGTAESPYEVSWEFLSSAQESYIPRLSENKIPARIAFLSGKRVRIAGYIAFPLVAQSAGECLLMLNQWDGCCIGIPPTPYDAVEVKLAKSISGWKRHSINFGAIEGTMQVEPYLVENWLVGLYLMTDARIDRDI